MTFCSVSVTYSPSFRQSTCKNHLTKDTLWVAIIDITLSGYTFHKFCFFDQWCLEFHDCHLHPHKISSIALLGSRVCEQHLFLMREQRNTHFFWKLNETLQNTKDRIINNIETSGEVALKHDHHEFPHVVIVLSTMLSGKVVSFNKLLEHKPWQGTTGSRWWGFQWQNIQLGHLNCYAKGTWIPSDNLLVLKKHWLCIWVLCICHMIGAKIYPRTWKNINEF